MEKAVELKCSEKLLLPHLKAHSLPKAFLGFIVEKNKEREEAFEEDKKKIENSPGKTQPDGLHISSKKVNSSPMKPEREHRKEKKVNKKLGLKNVGVQINSQTVSIQRKEYQK